MTEQAPSQTPPLAHNIEAIRNGYGSFTYYCHVCGRMGVTLAPELPCPGSPSKNGSSEASRG